MKRSKVLSIALVVLLAAVVTMTIISGTLAKYVETVFGTDTARVAKFEYTATAGGQALTSERATINLFNTVNDTEVYGASQNLNGSTKLIAPGTCGHFDVVVTNKSEVAIAVSYEITETNAGSVPIVYYIKDGSTTKYYSAKVSDTSVAVGSDIASELGLANGAAQVTINGDLAAMATAINGQLAATDGTAANATTKTTTVGWFWAFGDAEHNVNTADTTLGKAATPATVSVNIGVTFTQVD